MSYNEKQTYTIRMPAELRTHFEETARQNHRSLHAEILHRLNESRHFDAYNTAETIVDDDIRVSTDKTLKALVEEVRALRNLVSSKEYAQRLIRQGFAPLAE